MTNKVYVLDTSVLLSLGGKAFRAFPDAQVVIPLAALREVEKKRNDPELGMPARAVIRALDALREKGDLREGVLSGTTTVRVELNHIDTSGLPDPVKNDRTTDVRILAVANALNATLVTKDLPLRLLASVCGVAAADAPTDVKVNDSIDDLPTRFVPDEVIEALYEHGVTSYEFEDEELPLNSAAILKNFSKTTSALIVQDKGWKIRLVLNLKVSNVEGRSAEQRIALDHLTNKDIKIVSLGGNAGTGKTMLALAAGAAQLKGDQSYGKIIVFRSLHAVGGQELGFLPGDADEKMSPWTAAVYDALDSFMAKEEVEKLRKAGKIEVLPLTHVRGRTLTNSFIILDESQNWEKSVLLTALTRVGKNSKVVMSHDVSQRDNLHVGRHDGVYEVVQKLLGEKLFAHVTLKKSERSDVAELVSRVLDDELS